MDGAMRTRGKQGLRRHGADMQRSAERMPLAEKPFLIAETIENLQVAVAPMDMRIAYETPAGGAAGKFDGMVAKSTMSDQELMAVLKGVPGAQPTELLRTGGDTRSAGMATFPEALDSMIKMIDLWLVQDSKPVRELLIGHWEKRYGQGAQKVADNKEWYEVNVVSRSEEMLKELRMIKALADDPDPLGTEEKRQELVGRIDGIGNLAANYRAWVSALSQQIMKAYRHEKEH